MRRGRWQHVKMTREAPQKQAEWTAPPHPKDPKTPPNQASDAKFGGPIIVLPAPALFLCSVHKRKEPSVLASVAREPKNKVGSLPWACACAKRIGEWPQPLDPPGTGNWLIHEAAKRTGAIMSRTSGHPSLALKPQAAPRGSISAWPSAPPGGCQGFFCIFPLVWSKP